MRFVPGHQRPRWTLSRRHRPGGTLSQSPRSLHGPTSRRRHPRHLSSTRSILGRQRSRGDNAASPERFRGLPTRPGVRRDETVRGGRCCCCCCERTAGGRRRRGHCGRPCLGRRSRETRRTHTAPWPRRQGDTPENFIFQRRMRRDDCVDSQVQGIQRHATSVDGQASTIGAISWQGFQRRGSRSEAKSRPATRLSRLPQSPRAV